MEAPMSGNDLLKAMVELRNKSIQKPEKGFLTADEWEKVSGRAPSTTRGWLIDLIRAGKMEKRYYRIKSGDRIMPIPHYKLLVQMDKSK